MENVLRMMVWQYAVLLRQFHESIEGTIKGIKVIERQYYAINPFAVRERMDIFTENK